MNDDKNKNKGKIINIQKFDPKQVHEFTKEEMPYTQICNLVLEKCTNTLAGFIWMYLQMKPSTWIPCKWEIMKRFDISEATYKRQMRYLSSTGLVEYRQERNEDGTVGCSRIIVLNGSRFNPNGTEYKGVVFDKVRDTEGYDPHFQNYIRSIKNDTAANPAPDKGSNRSIKNDTTGSNRSIKKPHTGEMTPHINKDIKINKKKINNPPISPQGGNKSISFSLIEMIKDNPFNIPESVLADWIEVRKAKKAKLTQTAWVQANANLRKLKEAGLSPLDCFLKAVANGWAGVEFRYFDRDIDALKSKPRFPTPEERAVNEQKIREREYKAQKEKEAEKEAAKGFKDIVAKARQHVSWSERLKIAEEERAKLGMSATEYHEYITKRHNQGAVQEDPI